MGADSPLLVRKRPVVQCLCEDDNDVEQRVVFPGQLRQVQVRAVSVVSRMNVPIGRAKAMPKGRAIGCRREAKGERREARGEGVKSLELGAGSNKSRL